LRHPAAASSSAFALFPAQRWIGLASDFPPNVDVAYALRIVLRSKRKEKNMEDKSDGSKKEKTICACTNATHFLGRCQVEIETSEKLCAQCMKNHFTRNDDPTIVIE
jgi:hypothetical protein